MENKHLYIISGCNGAGKTTASYTVLPEILDCKEFVNAELCQIKKYRNLTRNCVVTFMRRDFCTILITIVK